MVTRKEIQNDKRRIKYMSILGTLILLAVLYVGVGFLQCRVVAKTKGEVFKLDWRKLITWPKDVF